MVRYRFMAMAFAGLALAVMAGNLSAKEPTNQENKQVKQQKRFDVLATKLGLSDQQKDQLRTIFTDYGKKIEPLREQLWTLRHEKWEAMKQVLTDEQRAKLPDAIKSVCEKEWQEIATKLQLTPEQKQKIEKIHNEFAAKFRQEFDQKRHEFRSMRHQFFDRVRQELTEKQRAELPAVLRDEFHEWQNAEFRQQQMKKVGDQLGLNAEQRDKIKKIDADFHQKIEKPLAQLKQLRKDEVAAMEKVLTADQRTKLQKFREEMCGHEESK